MLIECHRSQFYPFESKQNKYLLFSVVNQLKTKLKVKNKQVSYMNNLLFTAWFASANCFADEYRKYKIKKPRTIEVVVKIGYIVRW